MNYKIEKLDYLSEIPYDLLLLADPSQQSVDEYLEHGDCYVMNRNNPIGVYILVKIDSDTIELANISIKKQYQGQGIGKELIKHAIKSARINSAKKLIVGTGNSSINQLAFYQKCGFRISDIIKDFFIKNYEEEIFENGIQCIDMIRLSIDLE